MDMNMNYLFEFRVSGRVQKLRVPEIYVLDEISG